MGDYYFLIDSIDSITNEINISVEGIKFNPGKKEDIQWSIARIKDKIKNYKDKIEDKKEDFLFAPGNLLMIRFDNRCDIEQKERLEEKVLKVINFEDVFLIVDVFCKDKETKRVVLNKSIYYFGKISDSFALDLLGEEKFKELGDIDG